MASQLLTALHRLWSVFLSPQQALGPFLTCQQLLGLRTVWIKLPSVESIIPGLEAAGIPSLPADRT